MLYFNLKIKLTNQLTVVYTLREGGDGVARFELALQEAVLGLGGDLIHQLRVLCVWVYGQQLLLRDEVGGLTGHKRHRQGGYTSIYTTE